jgi:hypothetical protein
MATTGRSDNPLSPYAKTDQMRLYATRRELLLKVPYVASETRFN